MKSYVDTVTTAWTANAVTQAVQITPSTLILAPPLPTLIPCLPMLLAKPTNWISYWPTLHKVPLLVIYIVRMPIPMLLQQSTTILGIQANQSAFQLYANANLRQSYHWYSINQCQSGSFQTSVNSTYSPVSNLSAVVGNLIPITSNTYSIGSTSKFWKELFVGGNIQSTSFMLAATSVQAPLMEAGNVTANTTLIYAEAIVGNIRTVDPFGLANLGNIITSGGVFWANGVSALNTYSNATVATYLPTYTGNVAATNITLSSVVQLANLSQAQVANIAPSNGMMVYNHTYGNVQAYTSLLGRWGNVVVS
jgi:hypothetical protein